MGITSPPFLGLTIWILTIAPTIVTADHYCISNDLKYAEEDHLCSDIWNLIMNQTSYTFVGTLDNEPVRTSDPYQMCRFKKAYYDEVEVCCEGWKGTTCNTPDCQPPCQNGGVCVPPSSLRETLPHCDCPEGLFGGVTCQEDLSAIVQGQLMFCYVDTSCRSNITGGSVMGISDCCAGDFAGAWGSYEMDTCEPCQEGQVITTNPDLDMVTCMTSGDDTYRSFNNIIYNYHALCSVELLNSQEISIYSMTECDPMNKCACYKVVTIDYAQISGNVRYILDNNTITVQPEGGDERTINVELSEAEDFQNIDANGEVAWKYDRIQDTVYVKFTMLDLSLRLDPDGTFMLTVKHKTTTLSDVSGICGDWNLRPEDLLGLKTKLGAEKLFKDHINEDLPCGAGLAECPSTAVEAEAREACKPLHTVFHRCHRYVDVEYYMRKCIDYFCSSANIGREQAEKAACNAISSYSTACFMESNEVINFRSASLCPKDCKHPFIFNPLIVSACPPKCGATNLSYMKESCETVPHAGCECPQGYLRINYTCVEDTQCQCVGDDQRYYDYGMEINSVDHCLTCKCEARGLWDCRESADQCMATCKIMDRSHITTFDGNSYYIENSCGQLTLAESADGDLLIEMDSSPCEISSLGIRTCPSVFKIRYKGHDHSIRITPSGFEIDNGLTRPVYLRQVSDTYAVADIHGGQIRLIVSTSGVVQLKMKSSIYKGYVHGICGNLDGNKDNEFSAVTNAPLDKADFMAQFSKCTATPVDITEYPPITSTDTFCSFLTNAQIPPTSRINVDEYKKICARMDEEAKCSLLESFAMELDSNVELEFPELSDCFPSCERKEIDVCNANCKDIPYANCQSETIYDCGCAAGLYRTEDNQCIYKQNCGCYDFDDPDVHIPTGEEHTRGCRKCYCEDSELLCEDSCKGVICLNGQRSQSELMNNNATESCSTWMCPKPYHVSPTCIDVAESTQLCFCGPGLYQTQDGLCVEECPCHDGQKWYNHGEYFNMNCLKLTCNHGTFDVEETTECSRTCILTGSELKIKQFDSDTLKSEPIIGMCELVAFRDDQGYSVTFKPVSCQSAGTVCIYMINIYTPNLQHQIQLKTTKPNTVTVDGQEYVNEIGPNIKIVDTNYYLGILINDVIAVLWNRGLTLMIRASSTVMSKTQGLCGNFNLIASDDMVGSDMLPKQSLANFAQSWRVDQDCQMPKDPPPVSECDSESRRYAWASHKCGIITSPDGPFSSCLREGAATSYFQNCITQACTCNNGGDCECLCDAIAAYATFCGDKGHHPRWRNQRLCPMQCDGGSVYQACGNACPSACGESFNSSLCSSLTCNEGCFCPEGYVRSNLRNIEKSECIPESECPCIDSYGRSIPAGETVSIDCQECDCLNGSLSCRGEYCPTNCSADEFSCEFGHCIIREFVCDGVVDCTYGEDEFGCPEENCTGYPCKNKQCVPFSAVCDDRVDCLDGSDEEMCHPTCNDGEFECIKNCIPMAFVCDNSRDCLMGEDEENCIICPKNETHCNQTVCIPKDYTCDGHDDCGDGSDETGCTFPSTTTPAVCEHELKEITAPADYVLLDGGPTFADNAFTLQGWESTSPGGDTLVITLAGDGYKKLDQLSFVVKGGRGSEVSVVIETSNGRFDVQEIVDIGADVQLFLRSFDTEFVSIAITTTATISKLALKVCYEVPETTTVATTPSTETPAICEEGFEEVNNTLEAMDPVGSTFLLSDAKYVPLPGSDVIEFTLALKPRIIESVIYKVLFDVVDSSAVTVQEIGPVGPLITDTIDLTDVIRFVYTPNYPEGLDSINFQFDAIETTSVDYLGAKGCVKVKVCLEGDCFGTCYEDIPDRCDSECPTDDCITTPERTTSTIAQTTVCAHVVEDGEYIYGIPQSPYFGFNSAKLFLNPMRDSDMEIIEYRLTGVLDPSAVEVLIPEQSIPAGETYISTGGKKAFKIKVYDTSTFEFVGPGTEYIEGVRTEASAVYQHPNPNEPDTYFKIDNTDAGAEYSTFSGEEMEVYEIIGYSDDETYGPGNYEPIGFLARQELLLEYKYCAQPTTAGQTTGPVTGTAQSTTAAKTTGPVTTGVTGTTPFQQIETSTTEEQFTEITFSTAVPTTAGQTTRLVTTGVTPPCEDEDMIFQPVSANLEPSDADEYGDVVQQLINQEYTEEIKITAEEPLENRRAPIILEPISNNDRRVDGRDVPLYIVVEEGQAGVTTHEAIPSSPVSFIEKEARRTWPDLVIVKGTTETTVTVYELPPNESVVYVLKDGSNFDTFTGKTIPFNEEYPVPDGTDILIVIRPEDSTPKVKQCAEETTPGVPTTKGPTTSRAVPTTAGPTTGPVSTETVPTTAGPTTGPISTETVPTTAGPTTGPVSTETQTTTAGQTTGPVTSPGKVCADIMNLSDDDLNKLPIEIKTDGPLPDEKNPLEWVQATEDVTLIIQLPIGGNFTALDVLGSYDSYTIEVQSAAGTTKVKNIYGSYDFSNTTKNEFAEVIEDESNLIITFTGPDTGFRVKIAELRICIDEFELCRLTSDSIFSGLQFYPADGILGVSDDNVTEIKYGDGDLFFIEAGVVVWGSCYKCTCVGYTLICQIESNCDECPDYTTECVGDCTEAELVAVFDPPGVPESCKPNATSCTLAKCTTPHTCPGQWSSWDQCDSQCRSFRRRSCEGCDASCETNYRTSEMVYCDDCVTTPQTTVTTGPICTDNEVFDDCITEYENCMSDCAVFRKSSVCNNLDNATDCMEGCRCKEGFRRNMLGQCVEDYNCECYDGEMTTPIPMFYTVTRGLCEYCECYPTGYECRERTDCCDLSPWTDWSPCSATCGYGSRYKERSGICDDPSEDRVIIEECHVECECIHEGEVMSPGQTIEKNCEVCTCRDGEMECLAIEPEPIPWIENCEKKCYCENGTERCHEPEYLQECKEIKENCTGDDYVLREDAERPCCPKCVKIEEPCVKKTVNTEILSFNGTTGLCVSKPLDIHRCEGSCGSSSSDMYARNQAPGRNPYNSPFSLIMQSECKCCKAEVGSERVTFSCPGEEVEVRVQIISSCNCEACTQTSGP